MATQRRKKGAGSIRKLPSGKYQARFISPDGERHNAPHTFKAKGDATEWLNYQSELVRNDKFVAPKKLKIDNTYKLNDFFNEWIADQDQIRTTTRELYESQWRRQISSTIGTLLITSITDDDVRKWRQKLDPAKPTQRRQVYALLRQVLSAAVVAKYIAVNPAPSHSFGSTMTREAVILTPAEVEQLAENMPPRYRALVFVSAWCALRFGESAGLERRDIDIDARVIHVRRGAVRTKSGSQMNPPKSRAGLRKVTIPPNILKVISNHLDEFVPQESTARVFPGLQGGILAPSSLNKVFYPAREKIGYPRMHWHDLRHTGGTWASWAGSTLRENMDRLGHSTVAAAMRYQHSTETRQTELAEKLSKLADS